MSRDDQARSSPARRGDILSRAGGLLPDAPFGLVHELLEALQERRLASDAVRDLARAQQAIKACPDSIRQMGVLCLLRAIDADPAAQKEVDRRVVTAMITHAEHRPGAERLMWLQERGNHRTQAGLTDLHQDATQAMQVIPITSFRGTPRPSQRD